MAERFPARSSFHGVTAETGLNALTHAVEAYIGRIPGAGDFRQGGLYPHGPPGDAVSLGN